MRGPQARAWRPERRRSGRHRRDRRIGGLLTGIALLLFGCLVGGYVLVSSRRVALDVETGCPIDGPSTVTAILFDRTDPINDKQKLFLQNVLDKLRHSAEQFEEVDTYSLEKEGDNVIRPVMRICNPGRGTGANPLYSSPVLLEERWRKQFDTPLHDMLMAMEEGGGAKSSPIFEAVQSVSLQSFETPKAANKPKHLLLVSDLVQFTKTMNFYRGTLDYSSFRNSAEAQRLHTNLADVSVEVLFIPRAKPERISPLVRFWANWFVDQGVPQDRFRIVWVEG